MAHQRHANFLHDAGLHQPGVESVAEIMKPHVPDACFFESRPPCRLDDLDRVAAELNQQTARLALRAEQLEQARGKRELARFSLRSLRAACIEDALGKVDILPALAGDFSPAH